MISSKNINMIPNRILLISAILVAGLCSVHLEEAPKSASFGTNESTTTTTLKDLVSNASIKTSSESHSSETITTTKSLSPSSSPQSQNGSQNKSKSEEELELEKFKASVYYMPPYENGMISIPKAHKEYISKTLDKDLDLFFEILDEAIEKRNKFAPSVSLMWKYGTKLLTTFIKDRQGELRVSPRMEPKPSFFLGVADGLEEVLKKSKEIRQEKGYTKKNIDVAQFGERVRKAFNYGAQAIHLSPVGYYMKWENFQLYKNEGNPKPLIDEASDLVAMFSAMGYDNCLFVARRIINLLRFFSKGKVPSETEV